uniref:Uncharacterized protein n=1 Tax=Anguilla anguilla TaxID=7936 RepID=A0A0E9SK71_ANGAN
MTCLKVILFWALYHTAAKYQ